MPPLHSLRLLGLCTLLSSGACYRYVPLEVAAPPPGTDVRLYLTPQATTELTPRLGPETTSVIGRVTSADATALTLVVSETGKLGGGSVRWVGERVELPLGLVHRGERRVRDRRRTLIAGGIAAAATAGAFFILRAVAGGGSGEDNGGGGGPTP
jgi:hypothetical protein